MLESALLSFVQHGLHATSTATLARAAALSKGGLYRTIRSKAELIKAVYAYAIGQLQAPLLTPTGQVQPYERLQPLLTRSGSSRPVRRRLIQMLLLTGACTAPAALPSALASRYSAPSRRCRT